MDGSIWREGDLGVFDRRRRSPIDHAVDSQIEAIEMTVFGRDRQERLAASGLNQGRRGGDIPVMPVLRHQLEMILVSPRLGIEHDNRAGIQIFPLTRTQRKVGRGIPARDVQEPGRGIEGVRGPCGTSRDRCVHTVRPTRHPERRLALRAASRIARRFGH